MTGKSHSYTAAIEWTGNKGTGTSSYRAYGREHVIRMAGKVDIAGSADPAFRGDASKHNPEDMLVAALSTCHMLWYLHLAADAGVIVTGYSDSAAGTMVEDADRGGYFTSVTLHPMVTIAAASDARKAEKLHADAHHKCYLANSVNFPVECVPEIHVA